MYVNTCFKRCWRHCVASATALIVVAVIAGCGGHSFRLKNIAKSDIDQIADFHLHQMNQHLETLMVKLYKRNPVQLGRAPGETVERRKEQVFGSVRPVLTGELGGATDTNALLLAFDPLFDGDRVFALMSGLTGMVHTAYGNRAEFFLLSSLNQQALYNSARNIEILVWRLKHRLNAQGTPYILTDSRPDEVQNLSYERLFGKMISLQDMMAQIVAGRTDRAINFVLHNVASSAFLPVGL